MTPMQMIQSLNAELIDLRRDFHRHPELGDQEFRTAGKIADYLQACELTVERLQPTGVVGHLQGAGAGPTLLMRADMDALPIQEQTQAPYQSVHDGVMHACGHDGHSAMLLVTAKVLSRMRDAVNGRIKFVFQPNEENVGARNMIDQGVMDTPKVDACLGLHLWTPLPSGTIGLTAGPIMAGMTHFDLKIIGRGGHTATPQDAIDPLPAAANVIQTVQSIQTREVDVLKNPVVLMFGQIQGGTASNIIADQVTLSGTMRYLFEGPEDSPDNPKQKLARMVEGISLAHRTTHELDFLYGHPTLVNHVAMTALLQQVLTQEVGSALKIEPVMTLAGEDFSEFAGRAPSVFYFLGTGNRKKRTDFPHHHPCFDIDEDVLAMGVAINVKAALRFFADFPFNHEIYQTHDNR